MIADVNDVVGDYAESNPALDAVPPFVAGTLQPMPAFENADTSLTSSAPFLRFLEPALLLPLLTRRALGGMAGNRDTLHAHLFGLGFIGRREETGIGSHQIRRLTKL